MPKPGHAAVFTEGVKLPFSKKAAEGYAGRILSILKRKTGAVNILFVDDALIRRLNNKYRKIGRPTDVLAFETGDIVISVDTARRNARRFDTTTGEELKLYMIHGILHLSGYDDTSSSKKKKMRKMEEKVLKKL